MDKAADFIHHEFFHTLDISDAINDKQWAPLNNKGFGYGQYGGNEMIDGKGFKDVPKGFWKWAGDSAKVS